MKIAGESSETRDEKPLGDLMSHIVDTHHVFCRQEMARLSPLFEQAIREHGNDRPELKKLRTLFGSMARDLQMHLVKEEQTLFPYIARVEEAIKQNIPVSWPAFGSVENPIRMMVLEHHQTDDELGQIRHLSNGYTPPSGARESLVALYDGLRAFDQNMTEHVHAEDHLLFPRAIAMEEQACTRTKPA